MRAALLREFDVPLTVEEIDQPTPERGQGLVRIVASGVNPLDTKIQAGKAAHARVELPAVLGLDLAGVVAAVGADVTSFEPGDEVYGLCGGVGDLQGRLPSTSPWTPGCWPASREASRCGRPPRCPWRRSPPGRGSSTGRGSAL
ncbi:alcohol dehydrogenase catalytic domain-containing protein [Micromonospora sp. NIE79]|uniref:Alcohol dehydrogenase catalytic domain-containing protein n=2 Tax=Micromonospora trifolii TaxID=2911208 RepID=A0ABS9MUN0_9ACTN|nr:alcohol dehydrogenase catalytic domain-containing protein [Micromonospora trifolii]